MDNSKIKYNTILISKFMDFDYVEVGYFDDDDETEWQVKHKEWMDKNALYDVGEYFVNVEKNKWHDFEKAKYHSSWNLLMPVIKKLKELEPSNKIFKIQKNRQDWCDKINIIDFYLTNIDLNNVYINVVKAIDWYNLSIK